MPEGDTVRRTAARLHEALAGRQLVRAELRWADLGDVDLTGRTVTAVTAYGKHLLTRFAGVEPGAASPPSDASGSVSANVVGGHAAVKPSAAPQTLHSHLRMDGSWRIHRTGSRPWPAAGHPRVRAVLAGPEWTAVGLLLGMLELVPTAAENTVIGHLGPDIMADDWEVRAPEALRRFGARPDHHLGAALLDQTNVAGIGTFYMAEALFAQRVSPWTAVGDADLAGALGTARRQLLVGVRSAVPTTTGQTERGRTSYVHGRSGRACRRCGGTVRVAQIGEPPRDRPAFYCPGCQPGPGPTERDRPARAVDGGPLRRPGTGYRRERR